MDMKGKTTPAMAWLEIARRPSLAAFAQAFTPDATLEATVLDAPVRGPAAIRRVFAVTPGLYQAIAFTHEAVDGNRTYLEWRGTAFDGRPVGGMTVLARNAEGLIENVQLVHWPLAAVTSFAAELARRLA